MSSSPDALSLCLEPQIVPFLHSTFSSLMLSLLCSVSPSSLVSEVVACHLRLIFFSLYPESQIAPLHPVLPMLSLLCSISFSFFYHPAHRIAPIFHSVFSSQVLPLLWSGLSLEPVALYCLILFLCSQPRSPTAPL